MGNYWDLHRHSENSLFDGFGKPRELAKIAKEKGYRALGVSDHGSISGLVQHWQACEEVGIKPIMGCELYFQPKFNKENPQRKRFHLCLFVKNYTGYKNLCHIMTEANTEQFYYVPIVDFGLLKKYREGLICTTACIQGPISQSIVEGNDKLTRKLLMAFKKLFGRDLYIEIQPYKIDDKGTQQKTDYKLMQYAREYHIKCILTSDSHFGRKEDFDTYCKMHDIGKTTLDVRKTYSERYMPTEHEITERFAEIYKKKFRKPKELAESFVDNMNEIYDKVEEHILEQSEIHLPTLETKGNKTSAEILKSMVAKGLKEKGKWNSEYKKRALYELDVIHYHEFDDYFLMVQEYVNWAKNHGIAVGPGRGSACNCLVAYAIGITDVDSIKYKLDFSRFMRKDKKKMPDIDVDFETDRRQEVIEHVIETYPGKAVQICSYGEYNIDNLVNDLAKVCGLEFDKTVDEFERKENKKAIADIKSFIREYETDGELHLQELQDDTRAYEYNDNYDNIIKHFCKMYGKVRYLGKHAAGVAVVGTDISDYTCIVRRGNNMYSSCYDLNDLEHINCIKFDMLGLKTMSELRELEELSGHKVTDEDMEDSEIYEWFREGRTDGIFQMEKSAPKKILNMIQCDCMEDVFAVNALNRPAPLQLKLHELYARNKMNHRKENTKLYELTKETYGTMIYQEQTVAVAQEVGHLTAEQSFDMLKIMKKSDNLKKPEYIPIIEQMRKDFYKGCKQEKLTKTQTDSLWASMLIYGFNKGH